jgi:cbb3-type cytochrome oxidase subunit 3
LTFFIFAGDLLVMGFMTVLVVWLLLRSSKTKLDEASRIPLEDEHVER